MNSGQWLEAGRPGEVTNDSVVAVGMRETGTHWRDGDTCIDWLDVGSEEREGIKDEPGYLSE